MGTKKPTKSDIRRLRKFTELLPCQLTDPELLDYGNKLAMANQDIAAEEDRQTGLKQDMKSRLGKLEAERSGLSIKIARKEELREIEVESLLDFKADVYKEIRLDNAEVIKERPITEDERQEHLGI